MKILGISDLHLMAKNPVARLDDITVVQFEKLKYGLDWAYENEAKILQAGDFFHRPRSWTLLPKVIDMLYYYSKTIHCVYGQHDTYFYNEQTREATSLGILEKVGYVHCLDSVLLRDEDEGVDLYGASWGEDIPEPKDKDNVNILVVHAPIATDPLFPDHQYTSAKRFLDKHRHYDFILCGDIHRKFHIEKDGRHLINTGPMLRFTAEQYSFEHSPSFVVYDTDTGEVEWHEIPHKPANEVLTRQHIDNQERTSDMLEEFVQNLKESSITGVNLKENVQRYLKENPQSPEIQQILSEVMQDGE